MDGIYYQCDVQSLPRFSNAMAGGRDQEEHHKGIRFLTRRQERWEGFGIV